MNYRKPLAAAAMVAGLVAVGAGVAAADERVEEIDGQQIQLENEDAAEDDGEDGDNDHHRGRGNRLSGIAEILGVDNDELRTQIQDGATLAEVAEANGVSVDELVDSIVMNVTEHLDAKVEAGDLTEEEAAEKIEDRTERIENRINGIETNEDGDRFGRRGHHHDRSADDADLDTDLDVDTEEVDS